MDKKKIDKGNHFSGPENKEAGDKKPYSSDLASQSVAPVVEMIARRVFLRALGIVGTTAIADQAAQGAISRFLFGHEIEENKKLLEARGVQENVEKAAQQIANQLQASGGKLDQLELMKRTIDYLGTGLFVQGVLQLIFVKENNHINAYQYGILAILNGLKYQLSNSAERQHLIKEHEGAIKTGLLIGGAMTLGEGVNADIARAWKAARGEEISSRDSIALMTTLSLAVSSVGTTLVNSSVVRTMANDLADMGERDKKGNPIKDADIMAICAGHNTNMSGIALFGNPPFMAVCEKYGFSEGMKWKFKTMLPLAIYSWFTTTFKLNYVVARREGLSAKNALKKAKDDTLIGLLKKENIQFFAQTIVKSIINAAKYFGGITGKDFKQDIAGIEIKIGEVIFQKVRQLGVALPFAEHLEHEGDHSPEGIVHPHDLELAGADIIADVFLKALLPETETESSNTNVIQQLIEARDYEGLMELKEGANIPQIKYIAMILQDFHDDRTINNSPVEKPKINWKNVLNPVKIADRATDMNRIKAAAGHNLADVINVFPFQAGCIPFLIPVFKEAIGKLEKQGLKGTAKEITIFFMLQIFSMFDDNYVACKIGLELLPNSPHVALLASELGGPLTPIANMSNLGQFSMNDFPMAAALAKAHWHVDSTVMALAWSQALGILSKFSFFKPPQPLATNH